MALTSILKKLMMALTGLLWFGFVVMHLLGNFLLLKGPEAFNAYSDLLHKTGAVLYVAELLLVVFLLTHIYTGIRLTLENRRAKGAGYAVRATAGQASVASRTMIYGGIVLAVFIVTHVKMFKYGDASGEAGLWGLVVRTFQDPLMVAWYVLAMVALGFHLSHGFGSAFQTLGLLKPQWRVPLKQAGVWFGWAIAIGFMSLPIWSFVTCPLGN
jgi:succinate dehydrogenase / fumarate reductase, cytochrome b subunit